MGIGNQQLHISANADALARQLQAGRIDLWAYEENVASWFLHNAGFNKDEFETVYLLKEGELWFAFNREVSDEQIQPLQKAIKVRRRGDIGRAARQQRGAVIGQYE